MARAAILRFAIEQPGFSSLKSVFEQTMSFMTDKTAAERIEGLNTWGLEAIRAYLCGADHIFAGMATKLKSNREWIEKEIQSVFTQVLT